MDTFGHGGGGGGGHGGGHGGGGHGGHSAFLGGWGGGGWGGWGWPYYWGDGPDYTYVDTAGYPGGVAPVVVVEHRSPYGLRG